MIKEVGQPNDFLSFDVGLAAHQVNTGLVSQDEYIRWLNIVGAYWFFDYRGDPARPHALLTSGKHSDGFVDCLKLLKYPKATTVIVEQLVRQLRISPEISGAHTFDLVDWVFGSPLAGISLAYETGRRLNARVGFTEKLANGGKSQKRFDILPHQRVLLVEELITTLQTASEQREAIRTIEDRPANFIPALGVFFNRSGERTFDSWPIISVIEQKITNWTPGECPLCHNGSEAIRPKQNWDKLTKIN